MKNLHNFSDFSKLNENNEEYLSKEIDAIKAINTFEGLEKLRMRFTFGYMPLNPIDPIRTVLREKVYELRSADNDKDKYTIYLATLEGERKDFTIPPGAVH